MEIEQKPREHGRAKTYNDGCRCDRCKKAKSIYRTETPIKGHGTQWYYSKGCRCDACVDSNIEYRRERIKQRSIKGKLRITTDIIEMTRICYVCKNAKSLSEFCRNSNRRASMGRSHECRVCHNLRGRRNKNTPAHRFLTYKNGAKARGIKFDLSFDQFIAFWKKNCYYCDDPIDGIGLDRIDSDGSYVVENVRACCSVCNRGKTTKTSEAFILMCIKVAKKFENHIVPPVGKTK